MTSPKRSKSVGIPSKVKVSDPKQSYSVSHPHKQDVQDVAQKWTFEYRADILAAVIFAWKLGHPKCCACHAKYAYWTWRSDAPKWTPSQEMYHELTQEKTIFTGMWFWNVSLFEGEVSHILYILAPACLLRRTMVSTFSAFWLQNVLPKWSCTRRSSEPTFFHPPEPQNPSTQLRLFYLQSALIFFLLILRSLILSPLQVISLISQFLSRKFCIFIFDRTFRIIERCFSQTIGRGQNVRLDTLLIIYYDNGTKLISTHDIIKDLSIT